MQIQIDNTIINQQSQNGLQSGDKPPRPHGPPPPGSTPPGLESAVSTLSEEEQDSITSMLTELTEEQHDALKIALDELKPMAETLTKDDMGSVFLETLTQIANTTTSSGAEGIDVYA